MNSMIDQVSGVYLAVRNYPKHGNFFPTAYLTHQSRLSHIGNSGNGGYALSFTAAAKKNECGLLLGSDPIPPYEFDSLHKSDELPVVFSLRIMPKSRPDYEKYLRWLGLSKEEVAENPLLSLARSYGRKHGDSLETFAVPKPHKGEYDFIFPLRGICYLAFNSDGIPKRGKVIDVVQQLKPDEELKPQKEPMNPVDSNAVELYTASGVKVGYCPRVFAPEIGKLMDDDKTKLKITIHQMNFDAPPSIMVFCRLTCQKPDDFAGFCKTDDYKLLAPEMAELNV